MLDYPQLLEAIPKGRSKETKFKKEVINDFWICLVSRETSLLGRKEVLTGKAKFGILGDGKEVPQVAMARSFRKGDFRSGYYRDQTFMFALGLCSVEDFFAQLYADPLNDPFSGGRQMNSHFASPLIDENDEWLDQTKMYNISADISSTGGQMARALGLASASKLYRERTRIKGKEIFSRRGNEICFCTIGDASTSEGIFWETMNAAAVTQVPLFCSVWDDGYGISVPRKFQTVKDSISKALAGFKLDENGNGMLIEQVKAWDYPALCAVYEKMTAKIRSTHIPALLHVEEVTQPQGHSTSGSHERYKSKERLEWEHKKDCIEGMANWMIAVGICERETIEDLRNEAKKYVREAKKRAWQRYIKPTVEIRRDLKVIYDKFTETDPKFEDFKALEAELSGTTELLYHEVVKNVRQAYQLALETNSEHKSALGDIISSHLSKGKEFYQTYLHCESEKSALQIPIVPAMYTDASEMVNGYQVLNRFFDKTLETNSKVVAFGEDVGQIGGVNQGFSGLQAKYGKERVFDTGIREWSIMGQAIGLSMRGIRPIAEIQYLDYLIYGLQPLADDLATLRYRSNNMQAAPVIIRTRGHRLEGIWHSGSPLGMLINALRGIYIMVPRNMVQAAGMYNTMLQSNDPGLIIECLNGYRLKEKMPDNIGDYTVPLGMPEILHKGTDVTLVTYGSCVRVAQEGVQNLTRADISVELIDVQTLLPFDMEGVVLESLKKTNRIIFMDEDVPGGATAYMMQQVLEEWDGYSYLDSKPKCLCSPANRTPFGSDGDYFHKPNSEDVYHSVYMIMHEVDPGKYPL
jgi:pyruvate/2-oxoglutarate/acetoin dehydrogenase E1 component/TPP-dependent pyruvate/acetoin dehydrogenase alpha subunit